MKQIVVMSGKGGTGKTTITAALGVVAGKKTVMADCDVDAANMHLLFKPENLTTNEFRSGKTAEIDQDMCNDCGICHEKCRFDAIRNIDEHFEVDEMSCEGCSLCSYLCPLEAIRMRENMAGHWFYARSRFGHPFIHARLGIAKENSGKLVSKVKQEAQNLAKNMNASYILVDGPPGIGCPAISAFSGVDHVLIVTESSQSGLHDLRRLVELIRFFKLKASCIINKHDLNKKISLSIEHYCKKNHIDVIASIPYHKVFFNSLQQGKTLMETDEIVIKNKIEKIWTYLKNGDVK